LKLFTDQLLSYETGIDPEKYEWFRKNYNRPMLHSVCCSKPGRLLRHLHSGEPVFQKLTIAEYFTNIGINEDFEGCEQQSFADLRYKVINGWGFVGYQFGETLLMTLGYYTPKTVVINSKVGLKNNKPNTTADSVPAHYDYNDNLKHWSQGQTRVLIRRADGYQFLNTDTNEWQGTFTGKDDVSNFRSLKCEVQQESIINESMVFNLSYLNHYIGKCKLLSIIKDTNSPVSLSGLMAACHLSGVNAVINYLESSTESIDELGTCLSQYLIRFRDLNMELEL